MRVRVFELLVIFYIGFMYMACVEQTTPPRQPQKAQQPLQAPKVRWVDNSVWKVRLQQQHQKKQAEQLRLNKHRVWHQQRWQGAHPRHESMRLGMLQRAQQYRQTLSMQKQQRKIP